VVAATAPSGPAHTCAREAARGQGEAAPGDCAGDTPHPAVRPRRGEPQGHALLRDPRANEIVAAIDYDFGRFDNLPSLTGALLRTLLFDRWVADFLSAHPDATVVEIGTGLNTRYERIDNGRVRWFEFDLPDVTDLRGSFFTDTPRRTMITASVTDEAWTAEVASHTDGPYLFVTEDVQPYCTHPTCAGSSTCPPTASPVPCRPSTPPAPGFFDTHEQHDALSKVEARMHWYCPDMAQLADWRAGINVLASHTLTNLPGPLLAELTLPYQQMVSALAAQRLPQAAGYRLNLLRLP
jgi:hypothetical protein